MKFIVDQNLGSLTKWLRFLGFNAVQIKLNLKDPQNLPKPELDTFILTRQKSLPGKFNRTDLITLTTDQTESQLEEICRRLKLKPYRGSLTRCSTCNRTLQPISQSEAEGRVPDFTSHRQQQFFECPTCHKVYWEGSHQARIRSRLKKLQEDILTQ